MGRHNNDFGSWYFNLEFLLYQFLESKQFRFSPYLQKCNKTSTMKLFIGFRTVWYRDGHINKNIYLDN